MQKNKRYSYQESTADSHEAKLIKPDWLVEKVAETVTRQFEAYVRKE